MSELKTSHAGSLNLPRQTIIYLWSVAMEFSCLYKIHLSMLAAQITFLDTEIARLQTSRSLLLVLH